MRTKLFMFLASAVLVVPVCFSGTGVAGSAGALKHDAKTLFTETHKCHTCHSVPAAEIESKVKKGLMKGPDLGGKSEHEFETIAAFVRKKSEIDGAQHKKEFKGTDEELQTIVDWLGSLEARE